MIFLIITVIVFFVLYTPKEVSLSVQACIDKWLAKDLKANKDFVAGQLIIGFIDEVSTIEQMQSVLNEYELVEFDKKIGSLPAAVVKVPKTLEFEWLCRLEEHQQIKYVELNGLAYIQ